MKDPFIPCVPSLRGFPTFKSEIDPHFSKKMSFWLYLHVISFANT